MATRAEIMEKLGEVQHMLNIARHNRKEQEEATDANVARVLALLRLKSEISVEEMSTVLGIGADALGTTLGNMSNDDLVVVTKDEDDNVQSVTLGEKGQEEQPKPRDLQNVALDGFTDDEVDVLASFLDRIEAGVATEIGEDWKEREQERLAKKRDDRDDRKPFDRGDRGERGGRGGFRGGNDRGGYRGGNDRGGNDRGGYRGGNDRGGYRGGNDRGGNDRGGYRGGNDRGGYRGGNDRGGYRGGNDRGGYRGGNDRGGYRGGNDRGGYRGGNDRGGYRGGNDRGGYGRSFRNED
ncbi:MarR family winged helix-turn-helix transcriptional regulator [Olsenella sp. AF21-51]|uniref:MarR family winged helix-turn-helix transcriptional regulator n=1 Tax=Olsenella sp. AF21-51 TaxID=2292239 RepID=UPI0018F711C2|nr:MarR family winged helix-turn-helix transcriptional regulator [Olsenella sp. AF21-51]